MLQNVLPTNMAWREADSVQTAPVAAVGLIAGYVTARQTGIRPLGGVVLTLALAYAGRTWLAKRGPGTAGALAAIYLAGFGLSHPLAKKIGAWPAVLAVAGVSGGAAYLLCDLDESLE